MVYVEGPWCCTICNRVGHAKRNCPSRQIMDKKEVETAGNPQSSESNEEEQWTKVVNRSDKIRNKSSKRGSKPQISNSTLTPENPADSKQKKAAALNEELTTLGKGAVIPANHEKIENLNSFSLLQNVGCSDTTEENPSPAQNLLRSCSVDLLEPSHIVPFMSPSKATLTSSEKK